MTYLQYWLKIKWLWHNPNKKSRKKQLLSSVHAVCIQLRELQRLFKEMLRLSLLPFSQNPFFLCGATSQPRIKRTSQSIGTKVSLIIFFSFPPPINTSSFSSFTFGADTVSLFYVFCCWFWYNGQCWARYQFILGGLYKSFYQKKWN